MLKIEKTSVYGFEEAIRGMRNPMNSWDKSDSGICKGGDDGIGCSNCAAFDCQHTYDHSFQIGKNDYELMTKLRNAGTDHRKFMRMIVVYLDITAPLYWWKEFDTYKVGTVANSCSTMHKIQEKEFEFDDFSFEHIFDQYEEGSNWLSECVDPIIIGLNSAREKYIETRDKRYWWQMIQLLPSSYNQKRTVMLNYEVLANIYRSRQNHKLDEWREFCYWVETLPHSELIIRKPIESTHISDHDCLVISAYTGFLMCDFNKLHEFIEQTLDRPVFTHELAIPSVISNIQEKLQNEWLEICGPFKKEKQNDQS